MAVNVRAPFFLIQGAAEVMRREGVAGLDRQHRIDVRPRRPAGILAYSVSKGALADDDEATLAFSLMRHGIRVNQINPGWMDTESEDIVQRTLPRCDRRMARAGGGRLSRIGRLIKPPEVAKVIAFYLSDDVGDDDRQRRRLRPVGERCRRTRRGRLRRRPRHDRDERVARCHPRCRTDRADARRADRPPGRRRSTWRWCTTSTARQRRRSAAGLGVAHTTDMDAVLGSDDVDAVAICSSTDTHVPLMIEAARAGKAIFCEKPISLDLGRGRRGARGRATRPASRSRSGSTAASTPPTSRCATRSPAASSATSTSCASPAATRRRRRSSTSRCRAGSSST